MNLAGFMGVKCRGYIVRWERKEGYTIWRPRGRKPEWANFDNMEEAAQFIDLLWAHYPQWRMDKEIQFGMRNGEYVNDRAREINEAAHAVARKAGQCIATIRDPKEAEFDR